MPHTYIIAEIGVNHNGSLELAKQMIDEAARAGADAAKFQSFKAVNLVSKHAPKAEYQLATTKQAESQLQMLQKLELSAAQFVELRDYCRERDIDFLSSPFDIDSLELLTTTLPIPKIKIASGELTNAPMLLKAAQSGRPIILSTGMSTIEEIRLALGTIAYGYLETADIAHAHELLVDAPQIFSVAFASEEGQRLLRERVTILHCTTEYPAPFAEINLNVIPAFAAEFGLSVGYSDHTEGIEVPIAAVALGATLIEKHFTLDKNMEGPDHRASLEPHELRQMVSAIRNIECALGDGVKTVTQAEAKNKAIARKSVVAAIDIHAGEVFGEQNITVKRPGTGISPQHYWRLLGTVAKRDYRADELLDFDELP
jgi:N-acetylneuraminate synthase